jgi:hypothetical protein
LHSIIIALFGCHVGEKEKQGTFFHVAYETVILLLPTQHSPINLFLQPIDDKPLAIKIRNMLYKLAT